MAVVQCLFNSNRRFTESVNKILTYGYLNANCVSIHGDVCLLTHNTKHNLQCRNAQLIYMYVMALKGYM